MEKSICRYFKKIIVSCHSIEKSSKISPTLKDYNGKMLLFSALLIKNLAEWMWRKTCKAAVIWFAVILMACRMVRVTLVWADTHKQHSLVIVELRYVVQNYVHASWPVSPVNFPPESAFTHIWCLAVVNFEPYMLIYAVLRIVVFFKHEKCTAIFKRNLHSAAQWACSAAQVVYNHVWIITV